MNRIFSPMAVLLALTLTRADADDRAPAVYPVPRQMRLAGGMLTLSAQAPLTGADQADPDAVRALRRLMSAAAPDGGIATVIVGERGDPAIRPYESGLPEISGAYKLLVGPERIVLAGHDGRGTFYAVQSLRQLLGADGRLPAVEIIDGPVIPCRGTVEGFYGTPWTHADRLSQLAFYGRHKLNTYLYGPKNDPFHSTPNWRKPYPPEDADRIRELVRTACENKVDFVWAIHPGGDIRWTEEDVRAIEAKFQSMYELGVRSFAVFFDDIGGPGADPARQAELLNRLQRGFVAERGGVAPLILCPTQYNKAWSSGSYLDELGKTLDPSIRVMWTGDRVVADIDRATLAWINPRLRRKAYIWWNFPVSDYVRNHLLMGPAYGNAPDIGGEVSGFLSNPMEHAEASKVALYGVAGYTWNPPAYDASAAWEGAIRELMPRAPDAFRTFCAHNSDLGPNGHGYRRDESVAFRPTAERCLADLRAAGHPEPANLQAIEEEFARVAAAPAAIRAGADNPRLLEEIGPWLDAFEHLGQAGGEAAAALRAAKPADVWAALSRAFAHREAMREIDRTQNRNPYQPGVRTGTLVLEPLADSLLQRAAANLATALTGRPVLTIAPFTNSRDTDGIERMTDEDPSSYYYSRQVEQVGDYFGLDLGADVPVRRVSLVMGRQDGDHDIVHQGQLEASRDGHTWTPLGPVTTGERVDWQGGPVAARQVRYRVLHAGKLDGTKNDVYCAIRDFRVNSTPGAPRLQTSIAAWGRVPVRKEGAAWALAPQLEVARFLPNQDISLRFPAPVRVRRVEVDLAADGIGGWARLESSGDGRAWQPLAATADGSRLRSETPVRSQGIRVRHTGGAARDIKLAQFAVTLDPDGGTEGGSAWTDGRLETSAPLNDRQAIPVPPGARAAVLLFAPGAGQGVRVGVAAATGADPKPLGIGRTDLVGFPLPAAAGHLILQPAKTGGRLHEILWIKAGSAE